MYYLKQAYLLDDNIRSPWFNLPNWVTLAEYELLDETTKSYYNFVSDED